MNAQGRSITVRQLLEGERLKALHLEVVAGEAGLARQSITNPRLQKPGLALAGYLPYVKPGRVQILGESEYAYLGTLGEEQRVHPAVMGRGHERLRVGRDPGRRPQLHHPLGGRAVLVCEDAVHDGPRALVQFGVAQPIGVALDRLGG